MTMDSRLIRKKLGELERYVQTLEGLKVYTLRELRTDMAKSWSVEHGLQLAIQVILDTGNHILAVVGEQAVDEYADVIDKLGERGVLPVEFARAIRGMAGVRNILVHEYAAVDMEKIYDILQNRLEDFKRFAGHVERYLVSGMTPPQ